MNWAEIVEEVNGQFVFAAGFLSIKKSYRPKARYQARFAQK
jgi:hypothetical protein